eukprot:scaffold62833_cov63-Phaeocystis_antarctica.AAC.1
MHSTRAEEPRRAQGGAAVRPIICAPANAWQVPTKGGKAPGSPSKGPGSPGKPDFQGEAHKLYMQHGKVRASNPQIKGSSNGKSEAAVAQLSVVRDVARDTVLLVLTYTHLPHQGQLHDQEAVRSDD